MKSLKKKKKAAGNFDRDCIGSVDWALNLGDLGTIDLLTILNLPVHEHGCPSVYLDLHFPLAMFYSSSMDAFHHLVKFTRAILFFCVLLSMEMVS